MEEILDLERAEEIIDEDGRLCGISGDGDIFNDHAAVDALRLHIRLCGPRRRFPDIRTWRPVRERLF